MKETTMKMMLIVTIVLAIFGIVIKTINNTSYYNLVQSINNSVDQQEDEEKEQQKEQQEEVNTEQE